MGQVKRAAFVIALAAALAGSTAAAQTRRAVNAPPADQLPRFNADSTLQRPNDWETWVMVGSSTGLSYNPAVNAQPGASPGMFHNVYLQPWAYRDVIRTGKFPQGSMFILAFYEASQTAAPAKRGFYEGDPLPTFEVHVKKDGIDKTGWGFFNFGEGMASATRIGGDASCYECHATEAKLDHVFVQFYPALRSKLAATPVK